MLVNFDRDGYEQRVLSKYAALRKNRNFSTKTLAAVEDSLKALETETSQAIATIAVCGSYARQEASNESDLDSLILTNGEHDGAIRQQLDQLARKLGLPLPNAKGVFATDASVDGMLNAIGSTEETYADLSRRLLLLLESRPVFRPEGYRKLIYKIVERYSVDISTDQNKNFVFLINDLIRFFRTLCVNYQYSKSEEWGKWPIRNVKLRHSRVLIYFSLLAVLGELSKPGTTEKQARLLEYIGLTPLERLFHVYMANADTMFFRIAGSYDAFLRQLNNKTTRNRLRNLDYDDRYKSDEFAILKANSDAIAAECIRFLHARQGAWSDRFFEYLLI